MIRQLVDNIPNFTCGIPKKADYFCAGDALNALNAIAPTRFEKS